MKRIAILTLLTAFVVSCGKKEAETTTPKYAPVTEAVFAPGHLEATGQFTLTALNDGYITDVPVEEGDTVTTGQLILQQDNATAAITQDAASENLQITAQQAASNSAILQQLKAQLSSANQKVQNYKEQLDRMQRLYASRSVAKVDLDNAQLAYDNALNDATGIKKNIENTRLTLQQSLIDSKSQQRTAAVNNAYYSIKSPGNYTVYSLLKRKGDLVKKGEAVAVLGNASLMVVLDIDEASIAKVRLGQVVLVELNTEKGRTHTASVSKIYPAFNQEAQSYTIEAAFTKPQAGLINGTLLQANIIVDKKEKALLIPRSSLSPDGKVLVKREKEMDTVQVKTGIIATDWVEVLDGLSLQDEIIKTY
ncbi:efflux RND transporter periplasmic adaptor subunit [Flavobacterium sp. RHBU_24]|uniref:efflux RND transporter periplasmic adaptor subunit n=1 Tax=Flavobacterium sp. RHBU_24 TaxID=3391185 RepID=UPI0039847A74